MNKRTTHHYAGVLLVTDTGKLICQQRDDNPNIDNPGKVATFGGAVEDGENYRHAAWRELIEETNLEVLEESLEPFFNDISWRELTNEFASRHFYFMKISDNELSSLNVYEGKGWVKILGEDDPRLVDTWRNVIKAYKVKYL